MCLPNERYCLMAMAARQLCLAGSACTNFLVHLVIAISVVWECELCMLLWRAEILAVKGICRHVHGYFVGNTAY